MILRRRRTEHDYITPMPLHNFLVSSSSVALIAGNINYCTPCISANIANMKAMRPHHRRPGQISSELNTNVDCQLLVGTLLF